MLLGYPEGRRHIDGPHARHGSDGLWLLAHRKCDNDLGDCVPDVDIRRIVLARREEYQDAEPTYA